MLFSENEVLLSHHIKELHEVLVLEEFENPLFDKLFEILQNPIMFLNDSHQITISRETLPIHNKVWNDDLKLGFHDYNTIDDMFHGVMKELFSTREPVTAIIDNDKCVLCSVVSLNTVVGFIAVLEQYKPLSESDLQLLRAAADIISAKSERHVLYQSDNHQFYGQIIQDLIDEKITSEIELSKRLKTRNWMRSNFLRLITIKTTSKSEGYLRFCKKELANISKGYKQLQYKDAFLLLQESEEPIPPEIPKQIYDFIVQQKLKCGVSDTFSDMLQLKTYYNQTIQALVYSKSSDTSYTICYYDKFRFMDFLHNCCDHMNIDNFLHPIVSMLEEYDLKHETELGKTLDVYLRNDRSIQKTSSILFLHKNTINYRINKIKELFGMDLKDNTELLHIGLSYRLKEANVRGSDATSDKCNILT